jgi:hypothetical protein
MSAQQKASRCLQTLIHTLGLSCLGGAVFLELLVFIDILQCGCFIAMENNALILSTELALTFFAVAYFIYLFIRVIRSLG